MFPASGSKRKDGGFIFVFVTDQFAEEMEG